MSDYKVNGGTIKRRDDNAYFIATRREECATLDAHIRDDARGILFKLYLRQKRARVDYCRILIIDRARLSPSPPVPGDDPAGSVIQYAELGSHVK